MIVAKRILLFVAVNLLILITISILLAVLGIQPYLTAAGIDYGQLALFTLVWGMGGAFISLALSRVTAKWMMGVRLIDPRTTDPGARWMVETVHQLSRRAGLPAAPEVGIYDADEVNAFATGPTRSRALVAVSSGLLARMERGQAEGVLAHEVSHIANGDMVTMTLIQGVVNAFVMFIARVIAFAITSQLRDEARYMARFAITIALEIGLSFLGMMVVAYFSRAREFRADQGGAGLAGREKMISALEGLRRALPRLRSEEHASLATLKISGTGGGLAGLLATHPPLETRIQRLRDRPA